MKRRVIILGLIVVLVLVVAAGVMISLVGQSGSGALERWIGLEFQSIANATLNPRLSFTDLDYQYPGTVSLKNLRLTAEDPANPGKSIDILACAQAAITLAQIPKVGQPVVIEKILLDQPLFSAVAVAPNSSQFIGYSNLIRGGAPTSQTAPTAPSPSTGPSRKLSEVFQMRLVQLKDGKIVYDPRIPGTEAMMLDQINTALNIEPVATGWYRFNTGIARKPVFDLQVAGQLNLDSFSARDLALKLMADLGQDKLDYLPPQLQKIIKQYEAKGVLNVLVTGSLPVMEPTRGEVAMEVKLVDSNITAGEYRIPIDNLEMSARLDGGNVNVPSLTIVALKGKADITASAVLKDQMDAQVKLKVAGMLLQELLANQKGGTPPKMAGKLDAQIEAAAPLMVVLAKATPPATPAQRSAPARSPLATVLLPDRWGSGTLQLNDARLVQLPVIQKLTGAIAAASKTVSFRKSDDVDAPRERASVTFGLSGDNVVFSQIGYESPMVAVLGNGTTSLDQQLGLTLRGGPIEKVQGMLGKEVGGAIGMVTGNLLVYNVTGTTEDPKVQVALAGRDVGDMGKSAGKSANVAEEGVKKAGSFIGNIFKR